MTKVIATTDKLIITPHKPLLLKLCKTVVESETIISSSLADAVTATFFTTSTVDGGMYVAKDVISPREFVVVIVVV